MDAGVAVPEGGPRTASDVAVVVVSLFDHVDNTEQAAWDPGVGVLWHWKLLDHGSEA
jgi:hypothetical protein